MTNTDYPRMLFHRTKDPVTVLSREEEDALGPEWSRRIWQGESLEPDPAPVPLEPEPPLFDDPEPEPQPEPEPEEVPVLVAPKRRAGRPAAAKPATKKAVRRNTK